MIESRAEKDYRRRETIKKAVIAADRIIEDGSDVSEKEKDYLTANVAMELMRIALLPLGVEIRCFKPSNLPKRDVIQKAVDVARKIVAEGPFANEEEANCLLAEVAREFADKSLRPFKIKMFEKDRKSWFEESESHGATGAVNQ